MLVKIYKNLFKLEVKVIVYEKINYVLLNNITKF